MSTKKETVTATLSARLKKAREAKGLNKATLARAVGIDDGYLTHLEKGRREPSRRTVSELARLLDVRPEWLANGEGPMREPMTVHEPKASYDPTSLPEVRDLMLLIGGGVSFEPLATLPPGYLERYRERVADIERRLKEFAAQLIRELTEYRDLLMMEARTKGTAPARQDHEFRRPRRKIGFE